MANKYQINPLKIRKMTEKQLDKYIQTGSKYINQKVKRTNKSLGDRAIFSELIDDYKDTINQVFMGTRTTLPQGTKKYTKQQKQQIAYAINRLANVTETVRDVKKEYKENILSNLFKDSKTTEKILKSVDTEKLLKMGRDNIDFIRDILGSDRVNETANDYGDDNIEFYTELIQDTSKGLELFDPKEKEKQVVKWVIPE